MSKKTADPISLWVCTCIVLPQKGEHYHLDDGYDAMNNVYACGLLEDVNIEPEQDMQVRPANQPAVRVRVCAACA